jgi:hypothetical protein
MPWRVRKIPAKTRPNWAIQKKVRSKWKIVGRSKSKNKAKASVRIREDSESEDK